MPLTLDGEDNFLQEKPADAESTSNEKILTRRRNHLGLMNSMSPTGSQCANTGNKSQSVVLDKIDGYSNGKKLYENSSNLDDDDKTIKIDFLASSRAIDHSVSSPRNDEFSDQHYLRIETGIDAYNLNLLGRSNPKKEINDECTDVRSTDLLYSYSSASCENCNSLLASNINLVTAKENPRHQLNCHSHHCQVNCRGDYNWQSSMSTIVDRIAYLFNSEVLSDIHFLVGKGDSVLRIPAHKFILCIGSAVFDAMINGSFCSKLDEIEIPDVEPQAFLLLLKFLYSNDVEVGPENVMHILYAAKKYAVLSLEKLCIDFLKLNLSQDNAFLLLAQARLFDEPQLATLCLDMIDKKTTETLLSEGFTNIDCTTLCSILQRDTLHIREIKLFQAVVRWGEAKCEREGMEVNGDNLRKVLGQALSLIRFPLMTIEEFAQGPAKSNILMDKEIVQLFLHFTLNPKPLVNFVASPRCCVTGREQKVNRFSKTESRWGYSGTSDRIRFTVDKRIFVVGFGIYGSTHGPAEYEVNIQIIYTATGQICCSNDTTFMCDGSPHTIRVMFNDPFEIQPNINYTASVTLKGPDSYYGTKGNHKLVVLNQSDGMVTFKFSYASGNNNGTSVEDGQIPEILFYI